jgi:hypothetical protein
MTFPSLIPIEIWYDILQHLAESRSHDVSPSTPSGVANIALTCRFFALATRSHLFESISIGAVQRCDGLIRLFANNDQLASYIHHVTLSIAYSITTDTLWVFSQSSRDLMPHLMSTSTFVLKETDLTLLDVYSFASQIAVRPLSSITRLELGYACVYTAHELTILLASTPRLRHLETNNTSMHDCTSDTQVPASVVYPGPSHLESLNICRTNVRDPRIVEQLVNCLRTSGRFIALRKLKVWIKRDLVMPSLWFLLCDAASTLEKVELEVNGGDKLSSFAINFPGPQYAPIEAPRLASLTLRLGNPETCSCNERTIENCIRLLTNLRPSAPLSLTLFISIRRETAEEIKPWLSELDGCLVSATMKSISSVRMLLYCVRLFDGPPPLTEDEVNSTMPRIKQAGLLRLSLGNRSVRRWDMLGHM